MMYVYILQSLSDHERFYDGITEDLKSRLDLMQPEDLRRLCEKILGLRKPLRHPFHHSLNMRISGKLMY